MGESCSMRFLYSFLVLFLFICLAPSAQAEEDSIPIDEYKNAKPGLLLQSEVQNRLPESESPFAPPNTAALEPERTMTMDEITEAYQRGEFDLVMKFLPAAAENENSAAYELLGIMYIMGQGVTKNYEKALHWLTKAAEKNRPLAQHYLGIAYFTGDGSTTADPVRALMWLYIALAHYPEGEGKNRAIADKNNLLPHISRRDKNRALELARDWLDKKGEAYKLDAETKDP